MARKKESVDDESPLEHMLDDSVKPKKKRKVKKTKKKASKKKPTKKETIVADDEALIDAMFSDSKPKKKKKSRDDEALIDSLLNTSKKSDLELDDDINENLSDELNSKTKEDNIIDIEEVPIPKSDKKINENIFGLQERNVIHKRQLESAFYNYRKVHRHRVIKLSIMTILFAAIFVFIILESGFFETPELVIANESIVVDIPEPIEEVRTVEISQNISFDLAAIRKDQFANVTGFLKHELVQIQEGISKFSFSVQDDYANQIHLIKISDSQADYFIKEGITTDLFNVLGQYSRGGDTSEIKVESIIPTKRPVITKNITVIIR